MINNNTKKNIIKKSKLDPYINISKNNKNKPNKFNLMILIYPSISFFFFGIGVLSTSIYINKHNVLSAESYKIQNDENEYIPVIEDVTIRSPLNGIKLDEIEYEKVIKHIPHAVLISNNESARVEQYGLNYADIIYEAQVEGGITRFMAIFWSKQDGYIIKPVRSVRKYFLDWAVEYGNVPVTFTGFATTDNYETNSLGFYKEQNIRTTYFNWPFKWDEECVSKLPRMHCKRVHPEDLYLIFDQKEWTFDKWQGYLNNNEWTFKEELEENGYTDCNEFKYDFAGDNAWSTRWVYNKDTNLYEKHDPIDAHLDMNNKQVIQASTVIIQKIVRIYTNDSSNRVIYKTVGTGDAFIIRDGKRIDATWKKDCYTCRTIFYSKQSSDIIALKPGLIWIAAQPADKEINWY